ncbi:hypothetical protein [Sulfuricystis multivorans]|uniref:hypothetical protein n=1 Tax=Sulfuricystis multivorans TaxID=2211108 RepID=UPI000F8187DE|nr:hypothetical protein [Sulfuricystis multivorans]
MVRKFILALTLATSAVVVLADTGSTTSVEIEREPHFNSLPNAGIAEKRLYVSFKHSPKMTRILQEKMRAMGFTVAEKLEDADAKFNFDGIFLISGAGKEEVRGRLGELLESAVGVAQPSNPDYHHQNVDLLQIGVSVAATGVASMLSVTDMVRWIGQKTGIAGRFNELLTGDPRGFCYGDQCNKFTSSVILSVNGDSGHWWIMEKAQDSKVVLDMVISDAIENVLKPFYDVKKPAAVQGSNES